MMQTKIQNALLASIETKKKILNDPLFLNEIEQVAVTCVDALQRGNKILFCGNGGSAADAQHLAAELSGRFYYDRPPLDAEALNVNMSYITAVGNDYGYDAVFARALQAKGKKGDVLIAISTSGNSKNVVSAVEVAREKGLVTVGMTGSKGGILSRICEFLLKVPSEDTPRIQESHIFIGHAICEIIEAEIFPNRHNRMH